MLAAQGYASCRGTPTAGRTNTTIRDVFITANTARCIPRLFDTHTPCHLPFFVRKKAGLPQVRRRTRVLAKETVNFPDPKRQPKHN